MSERWPGGIISKTAPTPTGPFQNGTAPGVWTLEQQAFWARQNLWPIAGNVNPDLFIENLFSTWLYTGNGSSQTITNGINLSGQGGMVWIKGRSGATDHALYDTNRGATFDLVSNSTAAQTTQSTGLTAFNSSGFNIGALAKLNTNGATYTSWTFREQPKFFDVVTYTGNGVAGRTVAHSLGSVPGMIIVKRRNTTGNWVVYHRSLTVSQVLYLNTSGVADGSVAFNETAPTSSVFSVGNDVGTNANGSTYVAYLFAHDAGGFGASGNENVISCGSFTTNGSGVGNVSLGYEPQWILVKPATGVDNWGIIDSMRGFTVAGSVDPFLVPNSSAAENASLDVVAINSTGFSTIAGTFLGSTTYIYMAIRRGPMATPTVGTSVFSPVTYTGNGAARTITTGINTDLIITKGLTGFDTPFVDRLRGFGTSSATKVIVSNNTNAEDSASSISAMGNTSVSISSTDWFGNFNTTPEPYVAWYLRRAPGFFDIVCYTGTGVARTVNHNLTVVPELIITKKRSTSDNWYTYSATPGIDFIGQLNTNEPFYAGNGALWNNTPPTSSVFSVNTNFTNESGTTFVAYLFASVAGVSKVGSYTGTGGTQTIDAGLPTGARFVLIKRTDSTGSWWVWDTARGMVAGTDPRVAIGSNSSQSNANWVFTTTNGFQIVTSDATVNASGGTYIYLAIA